MAAPRSAGAHPASAGQVLTYAVLPRLQRCANCPVRWIKHRLAWQGPSRIIAGKRPAERSLRRQLVVGPVWTALRVASVTRDDGSREDLASALSRSGNAMVLLLREGQSTPGQFCTRCQSAFHTGGAPQAEDIGANTRRTGVSATTVSLQKRPGSQRNGASRAGPSSRDYRSAHGNSPSRCWK